MQLKKKKFERKISLTKDTRDGILSFCKMNHPNEGILILRGKAKRGDVFIDGLVVPPFSETGADFAGFPNNPLHWILVMSASFILILLVQLNHL